MNVEFEEVEEGIGYQWDRAIEFFTKSVDCT